MKQIHKFLFIILFVVVALYFFRVMRENDLPSLQYQSFLKQIGNIVPSGPPTIDQAQKIVKMCQDNVVASYPACLKAPPADPNDPLGYKGVQPTSDQNAQAMISAACYKASVTVPGGTLMCPGLAGLPGLDEN